MINEKNKTLDIINKLWNNYIKKNQIYTEVVLINANEKIFDTSALLVINDTQKNVIAIDCQTLAMSKKVPRYFIIDDNELIGFDINDNSKGFYPNEQFYKLYRDITGNELQNEAEDFDYTEDISSY